jgi:ABC-type antimicrobial peptide transport system permease subunit
MRPALVRASLRFYWRSHLALLGGVATTVAVLAGALLVGASVRASLAELAAARLGRTAAVLAAETPFPADLADRLGTELGGTAALAPLFVLDGAVSHPASGRRAEGVAVYGIDDRFFAFHGVRAPAPAPGEVLLSPALAAELGPAADEPVIVRVERVSAIPPDFLHGEREDLGRSLRLTFRGVLPRESMGEFSLAPAQAPVRAAFVALPRLQAALDQADRANTVLMASVEDGARIQPAVLRGAIRDVVTAADLALTFTPATSGPSVIVSAASGLVPDQPASAVVATARAAGHDVLPVLTWLANRIASGGRVVPYSLVTAIDPAATADPVGRLLASASSEDGMPIVLNDWAARDLGVAAGAPIRLEYYRWADSGQLVTESADFQVAGVVPMTGLAADRQLAPDYPGITDTQSLADWNPPFPIDLTLVRPIDDEYWARFRTTPKAFIALEAGQRLWSSRHGRVTSLRVRVDDPARAAPGLRDASMRAVDPFQAGFSLVDVRGEREEAAGGTTDFGAYFSYFSFFLIVSALLLTGVFFRLTVEQRLVQVGLLRAAGFPLAAIRRLYLREALIVATAGALLGAVLAGGWAGLLMWGLRTWWIGAVGTTDLRLHLDALSLGAGVAGGLAAAALAVTVVVRGLGRLTPRQLLTGASDLDAVRAGRGAVPMAAGGAVAAAALLVLSAAGVIPPAAGFFGAGGLVLAGGLAAFRVWLGHRRAIIRGRGRSALWRLGVANASWRPSRSLAAAGLVATAVFLLVAVDSFRKGGSSESGTGGFALFAEATVPIVDDPSTPAGREALGLPASENDPRWAGVEIVPARLRPGDEVGCLNLYRPMRPRVLGVDTARFATTNFEFAESLAAQEAARSAPSEAGSSGPAIWRLLDEPAVEGAVPAMADATSLRYSLHAAVGDVIEIDADTARPIKLRIVAALHDSLLQGELIVSDAAFRALFPREPGYRMFFLRLSGAAVERVDTTTRLVEERLTPFGVDVERSADRIAAYHRVENTYISTFQTLGGFGLLLGTLGLAAITARNVLERRRELALLGAAGLTRDDLGLLVGAEQATVVLAGILIGLCASILAVTPVLIDRARGVPVLPLVWILVVAAAGGGVALLSARLVRRLPLVASLRGQE